MGGRATRPGDVVRGASGKTVEIINTDAEGRLILGDALWYARQLGVTHMVDVATLTGRLHDRARPARLRRCSASRGLGGHRRRRPPRRPAIASGRCPSTRKRDEQLRSEIADMINSAGRPGGAVTAAAFLREFADDVPWAHLDIAGTAWAETKEAYQPKGATGVAVRTLIELGMTGGRQAVGNRRADGRHRPPGPRDAGGATAPGRRRPRRRAASDSTSSVPARPSDPMIRSPTVISGSGGLMTVTMKASRFLHDDSSLLPQADRTARALPRRRGGLSAACRTSRFSESWYRTMASRSACAMSWRWAGCLSSAGFRLVGQERDFRQHARHLRADQHDERRLLDAQIACRRRAVVRRRLTSEACSSVANSRDSSSLLFSAIALRIAGSVPIVWTLAAFSRAATASASGLVAKFRK